MTASYTQCNLHFEMLPMLRGHQITSKRRRLHSCHRLKKLPLSYRQKRKNQNTHLAKDFHDVIVAQVNSMHKFQNIQAEFAKCIQFTTSKPFPFYGKRCNLYAAGNNSRENTNDQP